MFVENNKSVHLFKPNFTVWVTQTLDFLVNVTSQLHCGKFLGWIFWFGLLWVLEMFIFLKSQTWHPVLEWSFLWEHCHLSVVFCPCWLLFFLLLCILRFFLSWCLAFLCFRTVLLLFGLLFLGLLGCSLPFNEILLFRVFGFLFLLSWFILYQRNKIVFIDGNIHFCLRNWFSEVIFKRFNIKVDFSS